MEWGGSHKKKVVVVSEKAKVEAEKSGGWRLNESQNLIKMFQTVSDIIHHIS